MKVVYSRYSTLQLLVGKQKVQRKHSNHYTNIVDSNTTEHGLRNCVYQACTANGIFKLKSLNFMASFLSSTDELL